MLSDRTIRRLCAKGELRIYSRDLPIADEQAQPASFDLRAGEDFVIPSSVFLLGYTMEWVKMSPMLVGRVDGKSSWARRGLQVHSAGFIDPGFEGQITLEFYNYSRSPIDVEKGKRIAQISFDWMDDRPDRVYGDEGLRSRYQGQSGVTPARDWNPWRDGGSTAIASPRPDCGDPLCDVVEVHPRHGKLAPGCPTCRTILNERAAGDCTDLWHYENMRAAEAHSSGLWQPS